jgi:hypothetical protein
MKPGSASLDDLHLEIGHVLGGDGPHSEIVKGLIRAVYQLHRLTLLFVLRLRGRFCVLDRTLRSRG